MKFAYTVKYNGVIYRTGEDVPMEPVTTKEVVAELVKEQTEPLISDETDPVIVPPKKRGRRRKE